MQQRAGDAVDWDMERRKWARMRSEVRTALTVGAGAYVAEPPAAADQVAEHIAAQIATTLPLIAQQVNAEPKPVALAAPPPAAHHFAHTGKGIDRGIDIAIEMPPPARLDKLAKPRGVPKPKLNIKADDLPMGMETLAQSWKKP